MKLQSLSYLFQNLHLGVNAINHFLRFLPFIIFDLLCDELGLVKLLLLCDILPFHQIVDLFDIPRLNMAARMSINFNLVHIILVLERWGHLFIVLYFFQIAYIYAYRLLFGLFHIFISLFVHLKSAERS
jgi:hypothetical protein